MTKPNLRSVPKTEPPRKPSVDFHKRLASLRAQLLRAAVTFVRDGTIGSRNDRLRAASQISGIPISLIEVETEK